MRLASSRSFSSFTTCSAVGPEARVHAHIQRSIRHKTESPARLVQLQAADPKVGQQAIDRTRLQVKRRRAKGLADQRHLRSLAANSSQTRSRFALARANASGSDQTRSDALAAPAAEPLPRSALPDPACSPHTCRRCAPGDTQSLLSKERAHGALPISSCAPPWGLFLSYPPA